MRRGRPLLAPLVVDDDRSEHVEPTNDQSPTTHDVVDVPSRSSTSMGVNGDRGVTHIIDPFGGENVHKLIHKHITHEPILQHAVQAYHNIVRHTDVAAHIKYVSNLMRVMRPMVTHLNRRFVSNSDMNTRMYNTYIYMDSAKNIVKIYNYSYSDYSQYSIIKEIAFQKYATTLSAKCQFESPQVLEYGNFIISPSNNSLFPKMAHNSIFFIKMSRLVHNTLQQTLRMNKHMLDDAHTCNSIANRISSIVECMQRNNLYHNDLNPGNVFLDSTRTDNIGIIDYGQASDRQIQLDETDTYTCERLKAILNKEHRAVTIIPQSRAPDASAALSQAPSEKDARIIPPNTLKSGQPDATAHISSEHRERTAPNFGPAHELYGMVR